MENRAFARGVLAPLLFSIFGYIRSLHAFQGGQRQHGRYGAPEEEKGGQREATAGEPVLATSLWGMVDADDTGVISQLPKQPRKMVVIVVLCTAVGLTISEAETEIICLRAKGMPESTATFSADAAGQV